MTNFCNKNKVKLETFIVYSVLVSSGHSDFIGGERWEGGGGVSGGDLFMKKEILRLIFWKQISGVGLSLHIKLVYNSLRVN